MIVEMAKFPFIDRKTVACEQALFRLTELNQLRLKQGDL